LYLDYVGGPNSGLYLTFFKSSNDYILRWVMGGSSGLSNYD